MAFVVLCLKNSWSKKGGWVQGVRRLITAKAFDFVDVKWKLKASTFRQGKTNEHKLRIICRDGIKEDLNLTVFQNWSYQVWEFILAGLEEQGDVGRSIYLKPSSLVDTVPHKPLTFHSRKAFTSPPPGNSSWVLLGTAWAGRPSSTAVFQWEQRLWDVFGSEIDIASLRFWREEYNPCCMGNTENTSLCSIVSNFCDAVDCSLPGSSVHGIFQTRILEQVAISYSRGSSLIQRLNPCLLCLLHCRHIPRG